MKKLLVLLAFLSAIDCRLDAATLVNSGTSSVGSVFAVVDGLVTNASTGNVYVVYGGADAGEDFEAWDGNSLVGSMATGTVSHYLYGLKPSSNYYFKLLFTNAPEYGWSSISNFATLASTYTNAASTSSTRAVTVNTNSGLVFPLAEAFSRSNGFAMFADVSASVTASSAGSYPLAWGNTASGLAATAMSAVINTGGAARVYTSLAHDTNAVQQLEIANHTQSIERVFWVSATVGDATYTTNSYVGSITVTPNGAIWSLDGWSTTNDFIGGTYTATNGKSGNGPAFVLLGETNWWCFWYQAGLIWYLANDGNNMYQSQTAIMDSPADTYVATDAQYEGSPTVSLDVAWEAIIVTNAPVITYTTNALSSTDYSNLLAQVATLGTTYAAPTSTVALVADYATSAGFATNAGYATSAGYGTNSGYAASSGYATNAGIAATGTVALALVPGATGDGGSLTNITAAKVGAVKCNITDSNWPDRLMVSVRIPSATVAANTSSVGSIAFADMWPGGLYTNISRIAFQLEYNTNNLIDQTTYYTTGMAWRIYAGWSGGGNSAGFGAFNYFTNTAYTAMANPYLRAQTTNMVPVGSAIPAGPGNGTAPVYMYFQLLNMGPNIVTNAGGLFILELQK